MDWLIRINEDKKINKLLIKITSIGNYDFIIFSSTIFVYLIIAYFYAEILVGWEQL